MNLQEQTFKLLEATGLNWTVDKHRLFSEDGKETDSFGIFRHDNGQWIGTVGERYEPFQNFQLAETIIEASEAIQIKTNRGGALGGGAKVYLQAELPKEHIGKSGIQRFITALTSHDGSTSIGFGSTNTVVVCGNTFHRAYAQMQKFKHTLTAKNRIELAIQDLRAALGFDESLMTNFKRMADLPLKDEAIARVIAKLFEVTPATNQNEISTRKKNQIISFANSLEQEISLEGRTIWALFNGVTRYTNHVSAPKDESKRLDYIMDGGGYELNNIGFTEIMQWVEENTADVFALTEN